ncbi:hypothetical protein LZ30DRAFT_207946 [Colletotrichum cereale]|nr:hypothetical protein LZ30DRAFT_207946 [Colletotrichum cereale]
MFSRRKSPCSGTTLPSRLPERDAKQNQLGFIDSISFVQPSTHAHPIPSRISPAAPHQPKVWGQGWQCPFPEMVQLGRMKMTLSTRFPIAYCMYPDLPWYPSIHHPHPPSTHHLRCPVQNTHTHTHSRPLLPSPFFGLSRPLFACSPLALSHSLFSHLFPCCALQGHDGKCKAPFPGLCPAPSGPLSAFRSNAQDAALVIGLTQMTSTVHCRGPLLP